MRVSEMRAAAFEQLHTYKGDLWKDAVEYCSIAGGAPPPSPMLSLCFKQLGVGLVTNGNDNPLGPIMRDISRQLGYITEDLPNPRRTRQEILKLAEGGPGTDDIDAHVSVLRLGVEMLHSALFPTSTMALPCCIPLGEMQALFQNGVEYLQLVAPTVIAGSEKKEDK